MIATPARLASLLAALTACVATDEPAPDDLERDGHADGCGGVLEELEAYTALPVALAPPATFSLTFLDVGQGDAALVRAPSGCAALLDAGPAGAGPVIKANLAALGIDHVDAAFVSHYHADHLGSLDDVERGIDGVPIDTVYDRGGGYTTQTYAEYAAHFAGRRVTATRGQVVDLCGEVTFTVVAVGGNGVVSDDENALSLVVLVRFGELDALIGGDLTGVAPDVESLAAPAVGAIELYKVHHHGSATSSNAALLAAMRPTASFISLGANNIFGHPAPSTMARLAAVSSSVWMTEVPATGLRVGPIVVTSATGDAYRVTQGTITADYRSKGVVDATPPTAPTGVTAVATARTVRLAWQPASDAFGVAAYRVHRDGALVAETAELAYVDSGLAPATAHVYRVSAVDADGNASPPSAPLAVTTLPDSLAPPLRLRAPRAALP